MCTCTVLSRSCHPSPPVGENIQPAQLLQQLVARAMEEQNNASGGPGGPAAASEAPLVLLNGHVCALSSETLQKTGNGFHLREPYQWESDGEAAGFLLPRWMWSVVGGETVSIASGQRVRGQDVHVSYSFWSFMLQMFHGGLTTRSLY